MPTGKVGEVGRIGQRRYSGVFFEEFLHELRGAKGAETYTEMSMNDSTIGAILFAIENLMRNCEFRVEPGGNSKKDKEAAEFVESCMNDMCVPWTDTLSEMISFITYGWSYHEIVYKWRRGKKTGPDSSKYDDGLIGWKKLPIRSQETLYQWVYKEHTDDLMGMEQWTVTETDLIKCVIPIEKALHFVTKSRKNNPEGVSILRTAYRDWYFKKRIQEIEGIGIERDLAGFPLLEAPEGLEELWDSEDDEMKTVLANATSIVSSIRRDSKEGLVVPPGWKLTLLSTGSRRQFDTNQIIERYNKSIATSVLTDFVLLGHESVGSFALADNKTKMFALAVGTFLDIICEVFNTQAIPRLIDANGEHFKGITDYPRMKHGDIEDANLEKIGTFIQNMVGVGALTPDDELEDYVRQISNLPERTADIPMEQRTGQVDPAAQQQMMDGQGNPPQDGMEGIDGDENSRIKGKSATMYEIKSIMTDYLRGNTTKNMAISLLRLINVPEKEINAYLKDYDSLRAQKDQEKQAKEQQKRSKAKPSEEMRREQKKERDIDDIQDEKEAEEAKKSLGRGLKLPTFSEILQKQSRVRKSSTFGELIAKFNDYHDPKTGRFASKGGGGVASAGIAGRQYGSTDTKDALNERDKDTGELKDNSLRAHMDSNGKLTPEREALHKQIIDDLLKDKIPVEGQATMTMLGGGPASGKSSVMNTNTDDDPHSVKVDPDLFKEKLPGYAEMAAKTDTAASFYHEESSALAKRFYEVACSENLNVIYDGTGDGKPSSVQSKIDTARSKGYRVEGKYVTIDTDEAVKRNAARYEHLKAEGKNPRLVPEDYVRNCHAKVTDISVKMASKFDSIEVWDNNGAKGQQKMIATGGNGKGLKVLKGQEKAFSDYLSKGMNGSEGFMTLPSGEVILIE